MPTARPKILLVGDARRREFREALAIMDRLADVTRVPDMEAAVFAFSEDTVVPEVIVLAQAHPGQYSVEAVDRLRRLCPLARVVGLLGSWCEGEVRSGDPWPAAIRLYWHQWAPSCQRELGRLAEGRVSPWTLPLTATDEERLLAGNVETTPASRGLVALAVRRFEMHDWLSAACRQRGYSTVWLRPGDPIRIEGATAAVFDGVDGGPDEIAAIQCLVARLPGVPIIALLDFPRIDDHARVKAAGAASILSKPLAIEDLFWYLERASTLVHL